MAQWERWVGGGDAGRRSQYNHKRDGEHQERKRRTNADHTPHRSSPFIATNYACSV